MFDFAADFFFWEIYSDRQARDLRRWRLSVNKTFQLSCTSSAVQWISTTGLASWLYWGFQHGGNRRNITDCNISYDDDLESLWNEKKVGLKGRISRSSSSRLQVAHKAFKPTGLKNAQFPEALSVDSGPPVVRIYRRVYHVELFFSHSTVGVKIETVKYRKKK